MPDNIDDERLKLLDGLHKSNELVRVMVSSAKLITMTGPEGLVQIAQMEGGPEMIHTALESLMNMIARQQDSINQLTEMWLSSVDHTETIVNIIESFKSEE